MTRRYMATTEFALKEVQEGEQSVWNPPKIIQYYKPVAVPVIGEVGSDDLIQLADKPGWCRVVRGRPIVDTKEEALRIAREWIKNGKDGTEK